MGDSGFEIEVERVVRVVYDGGYGASGHCVEEEGVGSVRKIGQGDSRRLISTREKEMIGRM